MQILLKNLRAKQYNKLAIVIAVLHALVFAILAFSDVRPVVRTFCISSLFVIAAALVLQNKFNRSVVYLQPFTIMYLWLIVAWVNIGIYWVVPILFIIYCLHVLSRNDPVVIFTKEHIIYPSFPKRTISWEELNNVVLKDGLLTIDFKNDRIVQAEVEDSQIDEKAFNGLVDSYLVDN